MSKNDITGDRLVSKTNTDAFRDGYDAIFKKVPLGPQLILKPITHTTYGKSEAFDTEKMMVERITGGMRAIYYWADGTWCDLEDYPSYTHKSDDVARIYLSFDYSDEQIQGLVDAACSRG